MQNRPQRDNFGRRWLRRILALLLGLLLFAEAGAVRAQGNSLGGETLADQNTVEVNAIELLQEGDQLLQEGSVKSLQQAINVCQEAQQ